MRATNSSSSTTGSIGPQCVPADLLVVDGEGRILEGDGEVEPSALFIHSRILRVRSDAACVLHTHQTYATTITVLDSG